MRLLFCCEFYHPSRGGVQEVMRQIAERMVVAGHHVTVATSRLAERDFTEFNGVRIAEFDVSGNAVRGMLGEVDRYRRFLTEFDGDAILIKAAQQWTFDAAISELGRIRVRKVFIPCGFSGLYLPEYAGYFAAMPEILRKIDHLIFYAERYRDIDFARDHGFSNFTIVPNGASETEFAVPRDPTFRATHGIGENDFVILTVGSPVNAKGHAEVAAAYRLWDQKGRTSTLILNGQWSDPVIQHGFLRRAMSTLMTGGPYAFLYRVAASVKTRSLTVARRLQEWILEEHIGKASSKAPFPAAKARQVREPIELSISRARSQRGKRVLKTYFDRATTVQAFLNADLFVFASKVEYSPLVLFESAAAGLPFITVPVGNAEEIVRWTGGGVLCPAEKNREGYVVTDPAVLAEHIAMLAGDLARCKSLAAAGRTAFMNDFNWARIAMRYETVLAGATGLPITHHSQPS